MFTKKDIICENIIIAFIRILSKCSHLIKTYVIKQIYKKIKIDDVVKVLISNAYQYVKNIIVKQVNTTRIIFGSSTDRKYVIDSIYDI